MPRASRSSSSSRIVLVVGALGGLLNGVLVTRMGLPSLVVTVGHPGPVSRPRPGRPRVARRQRLPRLVHDASGSGRRRGSPSRGRSSCTSPSPSCSADCSTGPGWGARSMPSARTPSAVSLLRRPVARIKLALFVLSGTVAALAGIILTARQASARADVGTGLTLVVVTIVLLGGHRHLRRARDDRWRRPRLLHPRGAGQRPPPGQRVVRHPEHRHRRAADRVGSHSHFCSPGQRGYRPNSERPAHAGRIGWAW